MMWPRYRNTSDAWERIEKTCPSTNKPSNDSELSRVLLRMKECIILLPISVWDSIASEKAWGWGSSWARDGTSYRRRWRKQIVNSTTTLHMRKWARYTDSLCAPGWHGVQLGRQDCASSHWVAALYWAPLAWRLQEWPAPAHNGWTSNQHI